MRYCINCGSENPDEASFCWKCGRELYSGGQAPEETAPIEPQPAPEEPTEAPAAPMPADDGTVTLEKTPERVTARRGAIILGLVTMVAVFCLMAAWEYSMIETGGFDFFPDRESESILEIAEMSGLGILIYLFLVLAALSAISAIVTPRLAVFGSVFLLIAGVVASRPFEVVHRFSGYSTHYELDGYSQVIVFAVICIVILVIGILANVMYGRSLSRDGKSRDRDTEPRNHGLIYNIDANWNVVRRKG